jgi:hypothetical protein
MSSLLTLGVVENTPTPVERVKLKTVARVPPASVRERICRSDPALLPVSPVELQRRIHRASLLVERMTSRFCPAAAEAWMIVW